MRAGEIAVVVLLLGAFVPSMWMTARGEPAQRLVGMEFASVAATWAVATLAVTWQEGFVLIIPLVLVSVTLPGTLVYIRLLVGKT